MTDYIKLEREEKVIMGIECRITEPMKAGSREIPQLWERFEREEIAVQIPQKKSEEVIALYCDYEGDHTQPYTLVIGCPIESVGEIPEGMVVKKAPAASYAVFPVRGAFPQSLMAVWKQVWELELPRSYQGDYEVYGEKFSESAELEVFIALTP